MKSRHQVHIIGAGWSGLACSVYLAKAGVRVQLLEAAPQAGGRARSVHYKQSFPDTLLDNGQHIMLGAYHQTLKLFQHLGIDEAEVLHRQALGLFLYSNHSPPIALQTIKLPAPLHLTIALLTFKNITWKDRLRVVAMLFKIKLTGFNLNKDCSVYELLLLHKQSELLIRALWEPLCLATMNTPVNTASAQVFLTVLDQSFNQSRQDSDLLFFKTHLSRAFCDKAVAFIEQNQGNILYRQRVSQITIDKGNSLSNFILHCKDNSYNAKTVVLATPAYIAKKLQADQFQTTPPGSHLNFTYQPICTLYLQYPEEVQFKHIMTGFFGTLCQWSIDHRINKQPGLIAVVISSIGKHLEIDESQLVEIIHRELKLAYQDLPAWQSCQVVTEKKATFSCTVNINAQRPGNKTSHPNLFLAGDYTNTGYPATLEGAVSSGIQTAKLIIEQIKS